MHHLLQSINLTSHYVLASARGPLASMHALDVMWVSFYSIGLLLISILLISAVRKWIHNAFLSFLLRLIAFGMFLVGTVLMVLVVFTWPN
ncbi:MAG: DUF2768 domain-containing protein [Solibacillus sp.]|uniref:DUF2768 domain-containing protein n=1 Tax=unclassified Solibacillus TaxID=2637870 RepID=UPI0030FAEE4F